MTPRESPNVLYVGGWGRSGSTVAGMLAGCIEDHVYVGEVRELFRRGVIENRLCGCGVAFHDCEFWVQVGVTAFGGWDKNTARQIWADLRIVDRGWTTPSLVSRIGFTRFRAALARTRQPINSLYAAIAEVAGVSVVVDTSKSPNYVALLESHGLEVRLLHLVRDPRAVVYSWRKHVTRTDSTAATPANDAMLRYSAVSGSLRYDFYNTITQLLPRKRFKYSRVAYEDLIRNPRPTLQMFAKNAGQHENQSSFSWLRGDVASVGVNHTVDGNPARLSSAEISLVIDDEWRANMPRVEKAIVGALTFPLMIAYRYGRNSRGD